MVARIFFYVLALLATWMVRNNPFFWDTIQLASKHAHFFYEHGFTSIILPSVIDSGHPPSFGMYLATVWKVFGKTLPASHFAMLPFLWGIIFFLYKIGDRMTSKAWAPWFVALCFADPVLAGQSVLVSPDVVLVFFFLLGFWSVLMNKNGWLALAVIGLGVISMRGMMVGFALYLYCLIADEGRSLKSLLIKIIPFLPGGLLALFFLLYHWQQTGWIGFHAHSTWAPSFEKVGFPGLVRNMAVLGWRFLDYGRVFLFFALGLLVFHKLKARGWRQPAFDRTNKGWQLMMFLFLIVLTTIPTQLPYKGLLAHRYLLPVFIALNLVVFYWITKIQVHKIGNLQNRNLPRIYLFLLIALLFSGNFWIYPKKISQGWDSTLAHLPWYRLSKQAEEAIRERGIAYTEVGTAFPNIGSRENIQLNGLQTGFVEKNFDQNCYILYSNIMNDFTDEEIEALEQGWEEINTFENRGVFVSLYKNPASVPCEN